MKMFVTAFLFAATLITSQAFATDPSVDITSFYYSENTMNSHVAEACGVVKNQITSPTFVKITVDKESNRPGIYNVVVGKDGHFCVTVTTYYGLADAELWN